LTLLEVQRLGVRFRTEDGLVNAVNDVSFRLERGRVLGIVGESGSGKSVTCRALLGLSKGRGVEVTGIANFNDHDLLCMGERELRAIRGRDIAMIFQDPMSALNPVRTVGSQLVEAIRLHGDNGRDANWQLARDMLEKLGIPNPNGRMKSFPGELSGGMRQRVMIAMALLNRPSLLIADEPTTALDVTTQAQVLELMGDLRQEIDSAIILITHDLGIVAQLCDEVLVMYAGRMVEQGPVDQIFAAPSHPYTRGLLSSLPTMNTGSARIKAVPGSPPSPLSIPQGCPFHPRCEHAMNICRTEPPTVSAVDDDELHRSACHLSPAQRKLMSQAQVEPPNSAAKILGAASNDSPRAADTKAILRVEKLSKDFQVNRGAFGRPAGSMRAVDDVSFELRSGETLAIVGESGCGKSTLARCIARLIEPSEGRIKFEDHELTGLSRRQLRPFRRDVMVVFQDPYGSLDPRLRVGDIIAEPLNNYAFGNRLETRRRVQEMLEIVGLNPEHYNRFPYEFSGGQRQRIGIARALALRPRLLVCDEPVSALDVSVQAQILNLLADLRDDLGLTYVFISHNLDVVRHIADRVMVMYLGRVVEEGRVADLFSSPKHPYTAALLSAVPVPDPVLARLRTPIVLEGDVPSPFAPPSGCTFHPRCPRSQPECAAVPPELTRLNDTRACRCYHPVDVWPLRRPADIKLSGVG
jgi:peptide/nickel transport system ATP-binding protein